MISDATLSKTTVTVYSRTRELIDAWSKKAAKNHLDGDTKIFNINAELLLFSAAYGYNLLKGSLPSKPEDSISDGDPIRLEIIWRHPLLRAQACMIVLAATSDIDAFNDAKNAVNLISYYAEHGAIHLKDLLSLSPNEALFELGQSLSSSN